MNDNLAGPVYFIAGRVRRDEASTPLGFHALLRARDDEAAIRRALQALAAEGFAGAELDRIGEMEGKPDEDPYRDAYAGALSGEIAIITFEDPFGDPWETDEKEPPGGASTGRP